VELRADDDTPQQPATDMPVIRNSANSQLSAVIARFASVRLKTNGAT
jgi:hypothetical protein